MIEIARSRSFEYDQGQFPEHRVYSFSAIPRVQTELIENNSGSKYSYS